MRNATIIASLAALLAGCGMAVQHQRGLAALHTEAHRQCVADPKRCAVAASCSDEVLSSLQAWQTVNRQTAAGAQTGAQLTDALIREAAARQACLVLGIPATGGR